MRNFQKILLIIMLALSVMACGDEANGPETPPVVVDPKSNYGIDTCEYTIVTTCEGLDTYEYNESFGFDFGIQLAVKLADSTKASSLDSLIIAADEYTYTFSGQQVKSLYKDSAGAFIISLTYKMLVSECDEYGNWNVRIYDRVKRASYSYKVRVDFSNSLIAKPLAYWSHPDT
ncbi:MAG TPA: hypothetical protein VHP30_11620, partial [Ignavibacteriales bacterium]|nr:hypothetical protein [Ignavibacteriales bacterium]